MVGGSDSWFDKSIKWKIGDDNITRFWEDSWVGEDSFQNIFPKLFFEFGAKRGSDL